MICDWKERILHHEHKTYGLILIAEMGAFIF